MTLEDGAKTLPRNVGSILPVLALQNPRPAKTAITPRWMQKFRILNCETVIPGKLRRPDSIFWDNNGKGKNAFTQAQTSFLRSTIHFFEVSLLRVTTFTKVNLKV